MPTSLNDEAEIRELMSAWQRALRAGDVEAMGRAYAEDVTVAGVGGPLWQHGRAAYLADMRAWLDSVDGPLTEEHENLTVVAGLDVAFAYATNHITGLMRDGKPFDHRVRLTLGFRKLAGEWKVVLDHVSAPIDFATGKVALNLTA